MCTITIPFLYIQNPNLNEHSDGEIIIEYQFCGDQFDNIHSKLLKCLYPLKILTHYL